MRVARRPLPIAIALLFLLAGSRGSAQDPSSAQLLIDAGRYAEAMAEAKRAVERAEREHGRQSVEAGSAQRVLAAALERGGRPSEALVAGQRAVVLLQAPAPAIERARALTTLSTVQSVLGSYAEAASSAERAVREAESSGGAESAETARALVTLADAYRGGGDYAKALPAAKRAVTIDEKARGADHPDTAESLDELGLVYASLRDWPAAEPFYVRSLDIRERKLGREHPRTAESLNNLAALYWARREFDRARAMLERCLAIKRRSLGDAHPSTATTLNNLAEVERALGHGEEAMGLVRQAEQVWEDALGPKHPLTATARLNLASFYWRAGRFDEARPQIEAAAQAWRETLGEDHPDTARAENLLAAFYQSSGAHRRALDLYRHGLAAEDKMLANVFAVTSEEQKLRFLEQTQGHYYAALSLVQRRFASDPDAVRFALELVLRRKGIVLDVQARTQEVLVGRLSGATRASWQRLSQQRSELAQLLLAGPGMRSGDEYRREAERLQAAIAAEEERLRATSGLIAAEIAQRQATIAAVAARLPRDAALVEFVRIRDWDENRIAWSQRSRYLAFILTADGRVTLVDLGDAPPIDQQIATALEAVEDPSLLSDVAGYVSRSDAALARLEAAVWQPLASSLAGRRRVVLGPDGELNKVPFAALRTTKGRYLVEETLLSHVASGRDLLREKEASQASVDLFLVANPAFDYNGGGGGRGEAIRSVGYRGFHYPPLPGTAEEAQVIPPLLKGRIRVLQGVQATESAVREAPPAEIIHFATHGFFLEDEPDAAIPDPLGRPGGGFLRGGAAGPMVRSGLAFAGANYATSVPRGDDGILTALEVSGLDLHSTDLVVLSACETALGRVAVGQGVYGLRRAFVLAGAHNLVMSLWQVNDKITRDLMERFYRAYSGGQSAAEALRAAQLETIDFLRARTSGVTGGGGVAPVNLWAPFMLQQAEG
jgi:CHAT domain-containing protein/Tfp pilus assembly protein PilF